VEYDYSIIAEWKSDNMEGTIDIIMESVSGKEPTITPKVSKEQKIEDKVKEELIAKIKAVIGQFVEELNSK